MTPFSIGVYTFYISIKIYAYLRKTNVIIILDHSLNVKSNRIGKTAEECFPCSQFEVLDENFQTACAVSSIHKHSQILDLITWSNKS